MVKRTVDCIGVHCPVPIAEAATAIEEVAAGETIEVLADDPAAENDFKNWCKVTGHELAALDFKDGVYRILIKKNGP